MEDDVCGCDGEEKQLLELGNEVDYYRNLIVEMKSANVVLFKEAAAEIEELQSERSNLLTELQNIQDVVNKQDETITCLTRKLEEKETQSPSIGNIIPSCVNEDGECKWIEKAKKANERNDILKTIINDAEIQMKELQSKIESKQREIEEITKNQKETEEKLKNYFNDKENNNNSYNSRNIMAENYSIALLKQKDEEIIKLTKNIASKDKVIETLRHDRISLQNDLLRSEEHLSLTLQLLEKKITTKANS